MRKSSHKFCIDEIPWFDPADRPLIKEILDTMDQRQGCIFMLLGSIQSFKSLVVQLKLMADFLLRPASWAWYGPNRDFARSFAEEKLNDLYDSLPILRLIEPADKDRVKALSKNLPHMLFRMLSAHTQGDRQSKTLQKIAMDEAWMYEPGELTEILGRKTSFSRSGDWQVFIPSSGFSKGDEMHELWKDSDQRYWHVDCQKCGTAFYPDIYPPAQVELIDDATGKPGLDQPPGGLHFDSGDGVKDSSGRISQSLFSASVYYECPHCSARLRSLDLDSSRFITTRDDPPRRDVVAWKWNALLHMPLAEVALLKAKADAALARGDAFELEDFDRKRALRPWALSSIVSSSDRPACIGGYDLGDNWADRYFRVMLIDVQKDHFYWLIRDFGKNTESRLHALGIAWSEPQLVDVMREHGIRGNGGDIREDVATGQYYFAKGCDAFIDGNYEPSKVRQMAARNGWGVLRGEPSGDRYPHADKRARIWNPIQPIEAFAGISVGEIRFRKNSARDILRVLQNQQSPRQMWSYGRDIETRQPEYLKHLHAWQPVDKQRKRGSLEVVTEWRQTYERDDWEWCECAAVVAASMTGLIGADAVENLDAKQFTGTRTSDPTKTET